jgi:formate dehydrogenase iron-sulfur subunit
MQGQPPACVEACPTNARIYGERSELLKEAKRRILEKPKEYIPAVYGAKEVGGTSTLYVSAKPFHEIGLKTGMPEHALPDLTWAVMSKIPNYVFWSGTLLAGIYWIANRKKDVAEHERRLEEERSDRHHK